MVVSFFPLAMIQKPMQLEPTKLTTVSIPKITTKRSMFSRLEKNLEETHDGIQWIAMNMKIKLSLKHRHKLSLVNWILIHRESHLLRYV